MGEGVLGIGTNGQSFVQAQGGVKGGKVIRGKVVLGDLMSSACSTHGSLCIWPRRSKNTFLLPLLSAMTCDMTCFLKWLMTWLEWLYISQHEKSHDGHKSSQGVADSWLRLINLDTSLVLGLLPQVSGGPGPALFLCIAKVLTVMPQAANPVPLSGLLILLVLSIHKTSILAVEYISKLRVATFPKMTHFSVFLFLR